MPKYEPFHLIKQLHLLFFDNNDIIATFWYSENVCFTVMRTITGTKRALKAVTEIGHIMTWYVYSKMVHLGFWNGSYESYDMTYLCHNRFGPFLGSNSYHIRWSQVKSDENLHLTLSLAVKVFLSCIFSDLCNIELLSINIFSFFRGLFCSIVEDNKMFESCDMTKMVSDQVSLHWRSRELS